MGVQFIMETMGFVQADEYRLEIKQLKEEAAQVGLCF